MENNLEVLQCPFCSQPHPKIRYDFKDCAIVKCEKCALMWLHPRPSNDQLYEIYGSIEYYSNKDFFEKDGSKIYGYVDYLAERINKQYGFRKIVLGVKKRLFPDQDFDRSRLDWLDVGCGLGFLMDVAFDEGFNVCGVEFSPAAVDYIRAKYTFPVKYGVLSEVDFSKKYDVISMFDVIEHMMDPISDLKKLRQAVKDEGHLVIQTMDSESLSSRLLGKKLEDFRRTREHLFFFSRDSIRNVLDQCGWEVIETRSIGQTFQIRVLVDRMAVYSKMLSRFLRFIIYPKWLLEANIYVNPGTKMMVYAKPK